MERRDIMSTATLKEQSSKEEAEIRAIVESVHRAHHAKDAAAIAAPYAVDAVVFSLAPPLAHHGVDVKEKRAWLDTWDGPIDLESRDFTVVINGDLAFCHGFQCMTGTPRAAGQRISFWMRVTVCLLRDEKGWRIVHEHTSVPFYMDGSQRSAFDLKP
jgi:ketosteroid isomerase-like protein